MRDGFIASLSKTAIRVTGPLRAASEEPYDAIVFLRRLGWNTELLDLSGLQNASNAVEQATTMLEAIVERFSTSSGSRPELSFDDFRSFADALQSLIDSVDAVASIANGLAEIPPDVRAEIPSELLEALVIALLNTEETNGAYEALCLVGIIEPAVTQEPVPGIIASDGTVLRHPHKRDRLRMDRINSLISDPRGFVIGLWDGGPGRSIEDFFSYLAFFAHRFRAESVTGVDPDRDTPLNETGEDISRRMQTFTFPVVDGVEWGFSVALARDIDDSLGVVIMPFGALSLHVPVGDWRLFGKLSGQLAMSISKDGYFASGNAGKATLLAYTAAGTEPFFMVGGQGLPELTLSRPFAGLRMSTLAARGAVVEAGLTAMFRPSGGDSFLSALLPSGTEPIEISAGLGWAADRGVYLIGGSGGLEVELPGDFSFGPATLSAVRVRLRPSPEEIIISLTTHLAATIGPLSASLEGLGLSVGLGKKDRALALDIMSPHGIGLAIEAGPVSGGGFIAHDADVGRYTGALSLDIAPVALRAFGLLDTKMTDGSESWSLLVFVSGEFPPVQLGFGFTLLGLGGLVGLHRDIDVDALFTAVRAGKAGRLLSPKDPVRDAPILARDASAIFPIQRGQHVFGPTVKLGWGSPEPLIRLDLALALTLPEPLRLVLIGTLRARVPDEKLPLAKLNVDVAGVLDFTAQRFDLEGAIYDSVIQGIPLSGGFAVRSCWGPQPELAFSVGGLHPAFESPPRFPVLERLAMDLSKGSNFKLRIEGYFAISSNTLQMGAGAQLRVRAAGLEVNGELGFDTLIVFQPFSLTVDVRAMAQVKAGGKSLCSVSVKGRLAGPGPWRVNGSATVEVLFFDVDVDFDTSFGSAVEAAPDPVDVNRRLRDALMRQDAWRSAGRGGLVLGDLDGRLLPDTPLRVAQEEVPLGLPVEMFGGLPIRGVRRTAITALKVGQDQFAASEAVTKRFAPGQLFEMDEAERLAAPAFEELEGGAAFGAASSIETGAAQPVPVGPQITIIDAPEEGAADPLSRLRKSQFLPRATAARCEGKASPAPARLSLRPEPWMATGDSLAAIGAAGSYQEARVGSGTPARLAEAQAG